MVARLEDRVACQHLAARLHLLHHAEEDAVVLVLLQTLPESDGDRVDVCRKGGQQPGTTIRVVIDSVPADHGGPRTAPLAGCEGAAVRTGEQEAGETVQQPHGGMY